MTDHIHPTDEPTAEELAAVERLLSDPAMWAEPSANVEDRVLASIIGMAATPRATGQPPATGPQAAPAPAPAPAAPSHPSPSPATQPPGYASTTHDAPADLAAHRRRRGQGRLMPLAAAAALVIVALGAVALITRETATTSELETVALAGTEAAPGASAIARIEERPNGNRILLDVSDLPPAPAGTFYTVWVIRDEPRRRIPAGTFHMRGGNAEVELWSGVSTQIYRTVSVTLNTEDDPAGAGEVVLRGQLDG
jgi:hypothetical protein